MSKKVTEYKNKVFAFLIDVVPYASQSIKIGNSTLTYRLCKFDEDDDDTEVLVCPILETDNRVLEKEEWALSLYGILYDAESCEFEVLDVSEQIAEQILDSELRGIRDYKH